MIVYIIVALGILGVSFWLSIRSLKAERILPGSELYTTVQISGLVFTTKFFESLSQLLLHQHSAATISIAIVAESLAATTYLRIPSWLLEWVSTQGTVKVVKPLEEYIRDSERVSLSRLAPSYNWFSPIIVDGLIEPITGDSDSWVGWLFHVRAVSQAWKKRGKQRMVVKSNERESIAAKIAHAGFESAIMVAADGKESGEILSGIIAQAKKVTQENNPLVPVVGSVADLRAAYHSFIIPTLTHGGYLLNAEELSRLVVCVLGKQNLEAPELENNERFSFWGEIRLPKTPDSSKVIKL